MNLDLPSSNLESPYMHYFVCEDQSYPCLEERSGGTKTEKSRSVHTFKLLKKGTEKLAFGRMHELRVTSVCSCSDIGEINRAALPLHGKGLKSHWVKMSPLVSLQNRANITATLIILYHFHRIATQLFHLSTTSGRHLQDHAGHLQ